MDELIHATLHPDDFDIQFRRQGWLAFDYAHPEKADPLRLSQRWVDSMSRSYSPNAFFDLFGQNTFRKLLGYIYTHSPCSLSDLEGICCNTKTLGQHLEFMQDQELAEETEGKWRKATRYQHVDNIGRTLEWYVAEWFKMVLAVPARYGVHVDELAEGGDLDVVAFVNGLRVWVECKSGRDITDTHLRLFLRRAKGFSPDIAILLIDTDASIATHARRLNDADTFGDPLEEQDKSIALYWGKRNVYVVNSRKSIAHSLAAVLRLYHAKVKYMSFLS
jgi:hypothetical protein